MTDIKFSSEMFVDLVRESASDGAVVQAARVSTVGAESKPEDDAGLIGYLMRNRHGSPFEHGMFTFRTTAPIFVWREHMRHRIASYNEESGRYKTLEPHFYLPPKGRPLVQSGRPGRYTFEAGTEEQEAGVLHSQAWVSKCAYDEYLVMLTNGIAREVARMVLPLNIYSTAYVTMNPRALMNFLSLRVHDDEAAFPSHPQWEIEQVAEKYEVIFADKMPLTYAAFIENGRVAP